TNVVPDAVTFRLDRRIVPEESPEAAEAETNAVIAEAARDFPGIRAVTRRVLLARPFQPVPGQEKLIAALGEAGRHVLREDIPATGVPLYTDARHYSAAGIPTVSYGAGPRDILDANAHRADERLPLDDLIKATKVVALAVTRLLG
ncbi:MAG: M20/M25/M40 family metallo-hydrolase, partial [Alphaproteobacteria bacterium]|nr:M20/M25/M40 family metallo-hydrolase [Alphaproteobacteria bacterium]